MPPDSESVHHVVNLNCIT